MIRRRWFRIWLKINIIGTLISATLILIAKLLGERS